MAEETTLNAGPQPAVGQAIGAAPVVEFPKRPARRNPKLTRDDMVKVLRTGGSILHNGEILEHEHQLPDDAELAKGDAEKEAAAAEAIDNQIAALTAARARLAQQSAAQKPDKADKKADDKPKG